MRWISASVSSMPIAKNRSAWITLNPWVTFGVRMPICTDRSGTMIPSRAARRNIVPWFSSAPASQVSECASKWMSDNGP